MKEVVRLHFPFACHAELFRAVAAGGPFRAADAAAMPNDDDPIRTTVTLSRSVLKAAKDAASAQGCSVSELLEAALVLYFRERDSGGKS